MNLRFAATAALVAAIIAGVPALAAADNATVSVATNDRLGPILVDSRGFTLYVYEPDGQGVSNCSDGCAKVWPPLTVVDEDQATAGAGVTGKIDVIDRTGGGYQVTYNGMPLYYFASDKRPGDAKGQDVGRTGAKWYVVPPAATSVAQAADLSERSQAQRSSSMMMSRSVGGYGGGGRGY